MIGERVKNYTLGKNDNTLWGRVKLFYFKNRGRSGTNIKRKFKDGIEVFVLKNCV